MRAASERAPCRALDARSASLDDNAFANLVKELRIDIDGEDRTADIGQKMANTGPDVGDCIPDVQAQRINKLAGVHLGDPRIMGSIRLTGRCKVLTWDFHFGFLSKVDYDSRTRRQPNESF